MFLMLFASVLWAFLEMCGALTESCGARRACAYIYSEVGLRVSLNTA